MGREFNAETESNCYTRDTSWSVSVRQFDFRFSASVPAYILDALNSADLDVVRVRVVERIETALLQLARAGFIGERAYTVIAPKVAEWWRHEMYDRFGRAMETSGKCDAWEVPESLASDTALARPLLERGYYFRE